MSAPPGSMAVALAVALGSVALVGVAVLAIEPLRDAAGTAVRGDAGALRGDLRDGGVGGAVLVLALALVHAVVFYPAEILNLAVGYVYGPALAIPLVMVGWTVSGLAAYALGRYAGRPVAHRLAGERRFRMAERFIERGGVTALLAARLVPVLPFSLVGYVAGAARVPVWRYTWTTVVGFLPITAAVVILGDRLDGFSVTDPFVLGAAACLLALIASGHLFARRLRGGSRG